MGNFFRVLEEEPLLAPLRLSAGSRVLDLGCGTGRLIPRLSAPGCSVVALDLSFEMVQRAAAKNANAMLLGADGSRLPFRENSMDAVVACGTFEYVLEPRPFFREVSRVLQPGALFLFTCWNRNQWCNWKPLALPARCARFSLGELKGLLGECAMKLEAYRTTLWIPRLLFWGPHRLIVCTALRDLFTRTALRLELELGRRWPARGLEWVIAARREYDKAC